MRLSVSSKLLQKVVAFSVFEKLAVRGRIGLGRLCRIVGWRKDPLGFLSKARGIVHIGGNEGEESAAYGAYGMPVLWIEALPDACRKLRQNIAAFPNQQCICALLDRTSGREAIFYSGGPLSSLFPIGEIESVLAIKAGMHEVAMVTTTLDEALEGVDPTPYDSLVIDVQGAEMAVLEGGGKTLERINWILAEASNYAAYRGGCTLSELTEFLGSRGFEVSCRRAVRWKPGVGTEYDVLYRRAVL